jgi:hypothetical protein
VLAGVMLSAAVASGLALEPEADLGAGLDADFRRKEEAKQRERQASEQATIRRAEQKKREAEAADRRGREAAADLTRRLLDGPNGCESVVFITGNRGCGVHWYEDISYGIAGPDGYHPGGACGDIKRLDLRTGKVTTIFASGEGGPRDLRVHYSGKRLLFSYSAGPRQPFHICEIDNVEPTSPLEAGAAGVRQITRGPWDDIEPCYLPNGEIVFTSNRSKRWVPCWYTQVRTVFRCDADGNNIRPLSSAVETENTPFVLSDGRIVYTRWEYTDRSQMTFHHLWTFNPDGTGVMVYYGNMHPWQVMSDAMSIPGTDLTLAIFQGGHGAHHRGGRVAVVDPRGGPDDLAMARCVVSEKWAWMRNSCPVNKDVYLAVQGHMNLMLVGADGRFGPVYTSTDEKARVWDPRPLRARPREPVIPDRVDWSADRGTLILADAYHGRKMDGVNRGEIKKLLILEELPKPVNWSGGRDQISLHGTYMLHRIIGTVPVEADGSAHFTVPALRNLFFVTLDKNDLAVKRMQSFVTVMPGETTGCVGCHERRHENARPMDAPVLAALRRPASVPEYPEGVPDVIDFPRDVQPALDRNCLRCHGISGKREGNVTLDGDRGPYFSHSFFTLWAYGQLSDGQNGFGNQAPRTIGTAASPLMRKTDGSHHGVKVPKRDHDLIRLWIESSCVYAGTYAALGAKPIVVGKTTAPPAPPAADGAIPVTADGETDESAVAALQDGGATAADDKALKDLMGRRCGGCHGFSDAIYRGLDGSYRHEMTIDKPKARFNRSLLFNLARPEMSRCLLAPLSRDARGWGLCKGQVRAYPGKPVWWRPQPKPEPKAAAPGAKSLPSIADNVLMAAPDVGGEAGLDLAEKKEGPDPGKPEPRTVEAVFADRNDPDYVALLRMIRAAKAELDRTGSFDVPGFRPNKEYVREMKRYGILPENYEDVSRGKVVDVHAIDQAYWRSFWWPQTEGRALHPEEFLR